MFSPHYTRFVVRTDDSTQVKDTKTRLLRNFAAVDNYQGLLREFVVSPVFIRSPRGTTCQLSIAFGQDYTDDVDETLVAGAIQGIGHIARNLPESTAQCLNALMACIKSPHGGVPIHSTLTARSSGLNILADPVVASAVVELKTLVQAQMHDATPAGSSSAPLTIVERLAYRIDEIRHSQARACVVWLVGQYAADDSPGAVVEGVAPWAPDVLRKVAKSLREEVRSCHRPLWLRSVELDH